MYAQVAGVSESGSGAPIAVRVGRTETPCDVSDDPEYERHASAAPAGLVPNDAQVALVPALAFEANCIRFRRALPALCGAGACHSWSWIVAEDGLPDASVAIENATIRALAFAFAYVWRPSEKL